MSHSLTYKAFISVACTTFIFFFVIHINYYEIYTFLKTQGLSDNEIDFIEIMEILAAIVGGIILTQLINNYSEERIIIISQLIYILSIINLTIFENYKLVVINLMLMAFSRFIFCSVVLIKFIDYFRINVVKGLTIYFLIWAITFVASDYSIKLLYNLKVSNILLSLAFMQSLAIINSYLSNKSARIISYYKPNLTQLIATMELEILAGFSVSYIIFSIYWDWEIFAENNGYSIAEIEYVRFYLVSGILLFLLPVNLLISYYNKFKLNILILLGLIGMLAIIQTSGRYNVEYTKILHYIMGALMYGLFINNLLILTDKFSGKELDFVVTLYLCISIMGGYIGIIATDNMIETFGPGGFIISLYSIIIILLVYYLLQFFSLRLYKV